MERQLVFIALLSDIMRDYLDNLVFQVYHLNKERVISRSVINREQE